MKVIILAIFLASYAIQVFGAADPGAIRSKIQTIKSTITSTITKANSNLQAVSTSELNIRAESRINTVDNAITRHLHKKGGQTCKDNFEKGIKTILVHARQVVRGYLNSVIANLKKIQSQMDAIKGSDDQTAKVVDGALALVTSYSQNMSKPLSLVPDRTLSSQIDNIIVTPINACLVALHND